MAAFSSVKKLLSAPFETGAKSVRAVASAEQALANIADERASLSSACAALITQRGEMLVAGEGDDYDTAIAAIDRQIDKIAIQQERLDVVEPDLLARLSRARGAAKAYRWEKHGDDLEKAGDDLVSKIRIATAALNRLHRMREAIAADGFAREVSALPHEPIFINSPGLIAEYESALGRLIGADARRNARHAAVAAPPARAPQGDYRAPPREFTPAPAPPKPTAKRAHEPAPLKPVIQRPLLTEKTIPVDADGQVSMTIFRPTEIAGQRIEPGEAKLTPGEAMVILKQGAGDITSAMVVQ